MTAYLLSITDTDCVHEPKLQFRITGSTTCDISAGSPCVVEAYGADSFCSCTLGKVDIVLNPQPGVQQQFLREKPGTQLPSAASDQDLEWLLRINNVESGAGRAQPWSTIKKDLVGADLAFSYENAAVCQLDQRCDNPNDCEIHGYEFVNQDHVRKSDVVQALARFIRFDLRLPILPVSIKLAAREETKSWVLGLDCGSGTCPMVWIRNDVISDTCEDDEYGNHFQHYYKLAKDGSLPVLIPHILDGDIVHRDHEFSCKENPYSDYRDALEAQLNKSQDPTEKRHIQEQLIETAVSSRVICPMALFEP
jgi:hypothetical protein